MRLEEWTSIVDGIFTAHGKNVSPSQKILAKWYELVCEIPSGPAKEIARQIETSTRPEANLGAQFTALWWTWRAAHPEQCARKEQRPAGCQHCDGGDITLVLYRDGKPYTCSAPCGHCRPHVPGSITIYRAQELGMVYVEPLRDVNNGKSYGQALAAYGYVRQQLQASGNNYAR